MRLHLLSETVFGNVWGEKHYFDSLLSNSRGLSVLIKDDAPIENCKMTNVIPGIFSMFFYNAELEVCN